MNPCSRAYIISHNIAIPMYVSLPLSYPTHNQQDLLMYKDQEQRGSRDHSDSSVFASLLSVLCLIDARREALQRIQVSILCGPGPFTRWDLRSRLVRAYWSLRKILLRRQSRLPCPTPCNDAPCKKRGEPTLNLKR